MTIFRYLGFIFVFVLSNREIYGSLICTSSHLLFNDKFDNAINLSNLTKNEKMYLEFKKNKYNVHEISVSNTLE